MECCWKFLLCNTAFVGAQENSRIGRLASERIDVSTWTAAGLFSRGVRTFTGENIAEREVRHKGTPYFLATSADARDTPQCSA